MMAMLPLLRRNKTNPRIVTSFTGTTRYVATEYLEVAVNAAVTLQRPLLVKGEPGTGQTVLAKEAAAALGRPLLAWRIKLLLQSSTATGLMVTSFAAAAHVDPVPPLSSSRSARSASDTQNSLGERDERGDALNN